MEIKFKSAEELRKERDKKQRESTIKNIKSSLELLCRYDSRVNTTIFKKYKVEMINKLTDLGYTVKQTSRSGNIITLTIKL